MENIIYELALGYFENPDNHSNSFVTLELNCAKELL